MPSICAVSDFARVLRNRDQQVVAQSFLLDVVTMHSHYSGHVIGAVVIGNDTVGDLESGALAQVLDPVGQLAGQPLIGQFRRNASVHGYHVAGFQGRRIAGD